MFYLASEGSDHENSEISQQKQVDFILAAEIGCWTKIRHLNLGLYEQKKMLEIEHMMSLTSKLLGACHQSGGA